MESESVAPRFQEHGTWYQATLEEEFSRIARQEAEGFAGLDIDDAGRVTVFVTPTGDRDVAVRAALSYLERTSAARPPEQPTVEEVRFDADQLWRWWAALLPSQHLPSANVEVTVDWPNNRVELVVRQPHPRLLEWIEGDRDRHDIPTRALSVVDEADATPRSSVPPPPRYPMDAVPQAVMQDTAFVCPVGPDLTPEALDSLDITLTVLTAQPSLDRTVRFGVEVRNPTRSAVRIHTDGPLFRLVIRGPAGEVSGHAPYTGPYDGARPQSIHMLRLCPFQQFHQVVERDPQPALQPGTYTIELAMLILPDRRIFEPHFVRGLDFLEVEFGAP